MTRKIIPKFVSNGDKKNSIGLCLVFGDKSDVIVCYIALITDSR